MIKNILKSFKLFLSIMQIEKSWELLSRSEYEKSLDIFLAAEKNLPILTTELTIMKGVILFKLKKNQECINTFLIALEKINSDHALLVQDKNYLLKYISFFFGIYDEYFDVPKIHYSEFKLEDVSKKFRNRFRLL